MNSVEHVDNPELISGMLGGSPSAFAKIVRLYQGDIRMIVSKWIQCPAAADDLAQDVFLAAYENRNRFDGQRSLRAWLIGIAKNKTKLHLRSEARRREHKLALQQQVQKWKAQELEKEWQWDAGEQSSLSRCIKKLPPESRQLIEKHYFDGNTLESIARESNRTGGSLRMMLLRIRKALAKCIRVQQQTRTLEV